MMRILGVTVWVFVLVGNISTIKGNIFTIKGNQL